MGEEEEDEMKSAHTAFRLQQQRAKEAAQRETGAVKEKNNVLVKERELSAVAEVKGTNAAEQGDGSVKPSRDALPPSLKPTTTVTRHTTAAATTPNPTPTKKVPDLQLSTLPAVPGASEPATKSGPSLPTKSNLPKAKSSHQPEAASPSASVSIAPEPDEVVVVSSSPVTSVGQPSRVQQ